MSTLVARSAVADLHLLAVVVAGGPRLVVPHPHLVVLLVGVVGLLEGLLVDLLHHCLAATLEGHLLQMAILNQVATLGHHLLVDLWANPGGHRLLGLLLQMTIPGHMHHYSRADRQPTQSFAIVGCCDVSQAVTCHCLR